MTNRPVLLAGLSDTLVQHLRSALPGTLLKPCKAGLPAEQLRSAGAVAAVVALEPEAETGFRTLRDLAAAGVPAIVVGPQKDADLILRSMREGAKEFVLAGDGSELARALRALLRGSEGEATGAVHAVFPAKGGVGATTLAANLAGILQARGERTCLVDLNVNMGDVLAFLDLPGGYSISDVVVNMGRLDRALLDTTLLRHRSGIHVLAQSHRVEDADRVDAGAISHLIAFLRERYDAVVLDGLRSFDDLSVAALDASDNVLLVATQEVPAVRDARRCLELFQRLGNERKVALVVNRYQKLLDIDVQVMSDTVGSPVRATVANDYPAVIRCVNKGVLLAEEAPKAQVTRDCDAIASLLLGSGAEQQPAAKRSFFQRILPLRANHATE